MKSKSGVVSLLKDRISCKGCGLSSLCLPVGLEDKEIERLDSIVVRNTPYHRGNMLYHQGDKFENLYIVKSGSVKGFYEDKHGNEHVVGFFLPGELIGLEAIHTDEHSCSAVALETAAICEIDYKDLEALTIQLPQLNHQLLRLLSKEVYHDCEMQSLLWTNSAEERVAAFLVSFSYRFRQRGLSSVEFNLSMSRAEIASFLGLAVETVSRTFSKFHEQGFLEAERKKIKLLDLDKLSELGGQCASTAFHLGQKLA